MAAQGKEAWRKQADETSICGTHLGYKSLASVDASALPQGDADVRQSTAQTLTEGAPTTWTRRLQQTEVEGGIP
jgi:hypothetical protein